MDLKTVLWGLLIPFIGTAAGAACVFFLKKDLKANVQRGLTGFAAGVMVAASIWSLIVPAIEQSTDKGRWAFLPAFIGFWLGILFLLLLDHIIPHLHRSIDQADQVEGPKARLDRTIMMVLAVTLHNIPEGMAVGVVYAGLLSGSANITAGGALALALGIAIQNFPEGAIISMPLFTEGKSKSMSFRLGVLSGAVEPAFGGITVLVASLVVPAMPYLLSFAAGAMLYVVVEELIPEMSSGEHSNIGVIFFAVGFSLMMAPLGFFDSNASGLIRNRLDGAASETETLLAHNLADIVGSAAMAISMIVLMLVFDWRMALACLWGVPVAFALLFGSRKLTRHNSEVTKAAGVRVSDGIQEALENIREIRATNQEERFLKDLNDKIDYHEKTMLRGELHTGIFVNSASVIMRLGVATTVFTGTSLILSGQIDFMVLFMFLLAITRVYAPFDQALALIAEMFMSQISASRLMEIHDAKPAEGTDTFSPAGHDIVFENVGFAYKVNSGEAGRHPKSVPCAEGGPGRNNEQVLRGVSFTAKEGEVTAAARQDRPGHCPPHAHRGGCR